MPRKPTRVVSIITFYLSYLCRFTSHLLGPGWRPTPQGSGGPLSMFLTLMVGTLGSSSSPPRGAAIDVSSVDGGCSRISITASQGARYQRFYHWWWALPDLCHHLSGARYQCFLRWWWVLLDLRQHLLGAHHRCFLRWWWTLSDLYHCLPNDPSLMFLSVDGGCSWISGIAS
jgi:hypothetical protein